MIWQKQLKKYQDQEEWDKAIDLLQRVIKENPDEMHAYIYLLFMLVYRVYHEIPLPEQHKIKEYSALIKKYFKISYPKYSENAEYLYFLAETMFWAEWEFDYELEDVKLLLEKAQQLDPENLVYQDRYYWRLFRDLEKNNFNDQTKKEELKKYIDEVLKKDSSIQQFLQQRGLIGEVLLGMKENWAKSALVALNEIKKS